MYLRRGKFSFILDFSEIQWREAGVGNSSQTSDCSILDWLEAVKGVLNPFLASQKN